MKESMQDRCKAGSMLSPRWMVSISVVELQVLREQFSEGIDDTLQHCCISIAHRFPLSGKDSSRKS